MKLKRRTKILFIALAGILLVCALNIGWNLHRMWSSVPEFLRRGELAGTLAHEGLSDGATFLRGLWRVLVVLTYFLPGLGWLVYALCKRQKKTALRLAAILLALLALCAAYYWPRPLPGIGGSDWRAEMMRPSHSRGNVEPTAAQSEQIGRLLSEYRCYRTVDDLGGSVWGEETMTLFYVSGPSPGNLHVAPSDQQSYISYWNSWVSQEYRIIDPEGTLAPRLREIMQ